MLSGKNILEVENLGGHQIWEVFNFWGNKSLEIKNQFGVIHFFGQNIVSGQQKLDVKKRVKNWTKRENILNKGR